MSPGASSQPDGGEPLGRAARGIANEAPNREVALTQGVDDLRPDEPRGAGDQDHMLDSTSVLEYVTNQVTAAWASSSSR